jgi:Glycosyl hydrolase catalytic core
VDDPYHRRVSRHRASPNRGKRVAIAAAALMAVAVTIGAVMLVGRPRPVAQAEPGTTTPQPSTALTRTPSSSATDPSATPTTAAPTPAAPPEEPTGTLSAKKGVSTWEFSGVSAALQDVGASWYWNWAAGPTAGAGDSVEFVPMIWGPGAVTADNLDRAQRNGTALLGFNEPDFASQSNLSVERALELWPQLQATGLRLGSPAPAVGGADAGGWLDRFLSGAAQRGYRVDFIALHWYGSDFGPAAVSHLRSYLQAVWDRYHLPIWLTEFALIRFGSGGAVYPSDAEQVAFINGATELLDGLSFVERYAWFALPTSDGRDGTGLYRDGATPTAAGVAYRSAGA